MNSFCNLLKQHIPALGFALLVGIVSIAPHLYFASRPNYQGITLLGADAEEHYLARIHEVYEGRLGLGNVFLGAKDQPWVMPPLGEWIDAGFSKLLFLDVADANVAFKFIFPVLIFLLFYAFSLLLFASKPAAVLGAAIAEFGYNLLSGPSSWVNLLSAKTAVVGFLTYTRPINPEITTLFVFGALYFFIREFLKKEKPEFPGVILAGILSGLSIYISIYPWSFTCGVFGLFFLWPLFIKDFARAKMAILLGIIATVMSVPFWINVAKISSLPDYIPTAHRLGSVVSHMPVFSLWVLLIGLLAAFAWPMRYAMARTFFLLCAGTLFVLNNQQVLTGVYLQPQHYHWYMAKPLIALMLGMYTVYLCERFINRPWQRQALFGITLVFLFYNAGVIQVNSYRANYQQAVAVQTYAPLFKYLNSLPNKEVVFSDAVLSMYVPIYTQHDAPNNVYAGLYLSSDEFYANRLYLEYRLRGVQPEEIFSVMQKERVAVSQQLFLIYYREQYGSYAAISDVTLQRLADAYGASYRKPIGDLLNDLGVTIVVWDTAREPDPHYANAKNLKELTRVGSFVVYRVIGAS
jgi:hypothetical protein